MTALRSFVAQSVTDSIRRAGPDSSWSALHPRALSAEHDDVEDLQIYRTVVFDEDGDVVMTDAEDF